MNLWVRMILVIVAALWRGQLAVPGGTSRVKLRVWFHDLDPMLHMNYGRYLTIMDLGRLDWLVRSGLAKVIFNNRWTPVARTVSIRYRRELRLFQAFRLETRLASWDETSVVMEQVFVIVGGERDGEIAARALFRGGIYDRKTKSFIDTATLMDAVGARGASPAVSADVAAFLASDTLLRGRDEPSGRLLRAPV